MVTDVHFQERPNFASRNDCGHKYYESIDNLVTTLKDRLQGKLPKGFVSGIMCGLGIISGAVHKVASYTRVLISFQIDGKKVSSIKDLIQESQPEEEQLEKQQEVAEKLKSFLMVRVHKKFFVFVCLFCCCCCCCLTKIRFSGKTWHKKGNSCRQCLVLKLRNSRPNGLSGFFRRVFLAWTDRVRNSLQNQQ